MVPNKRKITRILRKILTVLNYKYINQKIVQKHQSKKKKNKKKKGEGGKQQTSNNQKNAMYRHLNNSTNIV